MRAPLLLLAPLWLAAPVKAQSDPFEDNPIPDVMNVTLSEEISGASFRVDNGSEISDDTRFSTLKLPWSTELDVGSEHGTLHLSATGGLLTAKDRIHIDTASGLAVVDEDWTVLGVQGGSAGPIPSGTAGTSGRAACWRSRTSPTTLTTTPPRSSSSRQRSRRFS